MVTPRSPRPAQAERPAGPGWRTAGSGGRMACAAGTGERPERRATTAALPADRRRALADRARKAAAQTVDPELPMLTIADLGVLRGVEVEQDGTVVASLTPTFSGCPAMAEMRADVVARLRAAGFADVRISTVLDPPWSSDWITPRGRRALAEHGIAPPGPAPRRTAGPVPLLLSPTRRAAAVPCPRCGSSETEETSRFGATSCKALWRCRSCLEPFEHFKEI